MSEEIFKPHDQQSSCPNFRSGAPKNAISTFFDLLFASFFTSSEEDALALSFAMEDRDDRFEGHNSHKQD
jgi:hypothetical protein